MAGQSFRTLPLVIKKLLMFCTLGAALYYCSLVFITIKQSGFTNPFSISVFFIGFIIFLSAMELVRRYNLIGNILAFLMSIVIFSYYNGSFFSWLLLNENPFVFLLHVTIMGALLLGPLDLILTIKRKKDKKGEPTPQRVDEDKALKIFNLNINLSRSFRLKISYLLIILAIVLAYFATQPVHQIESSSQPSTSSSHS